MVCNAFVPFLKTLYYSCFFIIFSLHKLLTYDTKSTSKPCDLKNRPTTVLTCS